MIITELPNDAIFNRNLSGLQDNLIFYGYSSEKYFYPEHRTPFLFITNFLSSGKYLLNKREIEITEKYFYFLNANDNLEIQFHRSVPLKTLGIVFNQKFIDSSLQFLTHTDAQLLELGNNQGLKTLHIPSVPFMLDNSLRDKLSCLLQKEMNEEEFDIKLFEIFSQFLILNNEALKHLQRIDAVKKSTKEELYRRLVKSREFIHDNFEKNLTIDQLAREACLNKFHFLDNFKKLFNKTPHQYLNEVKFQKAYYFLKEKQMGVAEVCFSLGFESVGSFSNLFKRKFQLSPSDLLHRI